MKILLATMRRKNTETTIIPRKRSGKILINLHIRFICFSFKTKLEQVFRPTSIIFRWWYLIIALCIIIFVAIVVGVIVGMKCRRGGSYSSNGRFVCYACDSYRGSSISERLEIRFGLCRRSIPAPRDGAAAESGAGEPDNHAEDTRISIPSLPAGSSVPATVGCVNMIITSSILPNDF